MRNLILTIALILLSMNSNAASLISGATITSVGSTHGNESVFRIRTTGGSGPCAGEFIIFDKTYTANNDTEVIARSYATALTAFSLEKKVNVWNYIDDTCTKATFIEIY